MIEAGVWWVSGDSVNSSNLFGEQLAVCDKDFDFGIPVCF